MATEVLRAHNVLLPPSQQQQHRVRAGHQKPAGAARKAGGRRHQPQQGAGRKQVAALARSYPRAAAEVYAGPGFSTSPEPNALPLPQFIPVRKAGGGVDDAATRDLRRILRLE